MLLFQNPKCYIRPGINASPVEFNVICQETPAQVSPKPRPSPGIQVTSVGCAKPILVRTINAPPPPPPPPRVSTLQTKFDIYVIGGFRQRSKNS